MNPVLTSRVFVCLLALGLGACKEDSLVDAEEPKILNTSELCALYLSFSVNSDTEARALGPLCVQHDVFTAEDITARQLEVACRNGTAGATWAQSLERAVTEGRVEIDWEAANSCLDSSRELRKNNPPYTLLGAKKADWDALKNGACKTFIKPKRAAGQSCVDYWDCPEGTGCYTDTPFTPNSRTCMPLASVGQTCAAQVIPSDAQALDDLLGPGGWDVRESQTIWHPCEAGSWCEDNVCAALLPAGQPCDSALDCASLICGEDFLCASQPQPAPLGSPCSDVSECGGECVTCRPSSILADSTCQLFAGEGEFCRTWDDCVWDLGCVDGACTQSADGTACGGGQQVVCRAGSQCMPSVNCAEILDETDCGAEADCSWDVDFLECVAAAGTCTPLPASGACLLGVACDNRVASCVLDTAQCQPWAQSGQTCDELSESAPPCDLGLTCSGGKCVAACEVNADCGAGQFCDTFQDPPACAPFNLVDCYDDTECPGAQYCKSCDLYVDEAACTGDTDCGWDAFSYCANADDCFLDTEATCNANPNCDWEVTCNFIPSCFSFTTQQTCDDTDGCAWTGTSCATGCSQHDDETACGGDGGCVWDDVLAACYPVCDTLLSEVDCDNRATICEWIPDDGLCIAGYDCAQHDGSGTACAAAPNSACEYVESGFCDPLDFDRAYVCSPKIATGGLCGTSTQCEGGVCGLADDGANRCAEPASAAGCNGDTGARETLIVQMSFLFGIVWTLRGRRRRKG